MLDYPTRKARLPHGAVTAVAEKTGYAKSTVHEVLSGDLRNTRIEAALAAYMDPPTTRAEAFGPPKRVLVRSRALVGT